MVTKERFEQGLTLQQYVEHMSVNRERFVDALDEVTIGPADAQILERLGGTRRVLVISEDWCGTCLAHVPFVAKQIAQVKGVSTEEIGQVTSANFERLFRIGTA